MTKRLFALVILTIAAISSHANAATLHGTIYEWSDFERPLKNAIIEVNSTPPQYVVATTGTYTFNLPTGNYLIKAKYYLNNVVEFSTEEDIQIDQEGDFIHDLLLFPPTESDDEYLGDINLTADMDRNEGEFAYYILFFLILLISAILVFYWQKKKKIKSEPIENEIAEPPFEGKAGRNVDLPEDLRNLHDIIQKMGGRATQKELRKKIAFSEAKVSLMLDDLEDRGLIKKIRKGRSNIIICRE